ncbi:MAG: sigma-54-dependent Fis family transcriptional regulator, partial [Bacteroidetes bacterium]|nr:sigma-54-dependent Fis family transcriptional regulator [Bacteroidota bacterium]
GIDNIIGTSEGMQRVFETVEMVAPTNATVLIQGASGTGKELIAKAIHQCSKRSENPFIKTNCAAIPEGLVESELFGHEKGAFTGALKNTKGRFELADGGTLLLDEISEIQPNLQAKLLRVLQELEFEKVGNPQTIKVDVRIIATTNRDLRKEIAKGNFREDLFHRLSVILINVPSLNDRIDDIPILLNHFNELISVNQGITPKEFTKDAIAALQKTNWTGNIREFANVVERLIILCDSKITGKDVELFANPGA